MKRKGLLIVTGCGDKRFSNLQARDQLPFPAPGRFGSFTIRHAFLLRCMLVLIEPDAEENSALGIDLSQKLVSGAGGCAAERYGPSPRDLVGLENAVWFAGIEFAGTDRHGQTERWKGTFAGPIAELGNFTEAQLADPTSQALRGAHAVRVFGAVNASAAAAHVLAEAEQLGIDG